MVEDSNPDDLPTINGQIVFDAVNSTFPDVYRPEINFERLYHYTNAEGLHGVVTSGEFWATNLLFMNDRTETKYPREIFHRVVTECKGRKQDALVALFLMFLESSLLGHRPMDTYAVCFCKDPDLLSQWRAYGEKTGGCSIGVDIDKLLAAPSSFSLKRMLYDEERQLEVTRFIIAHTTSYIEAGDFSVFSEMPLNESSIVLHLANTTLDWLDRFGEVFKDPGFREEDEWRLTQNHSRIVRLLSDGAHENRSGVSYRDGVPSTHFRVASGIITPYAKFTLRQSSLEPGVSDALNPISEIIVGPGQEFEKTRHAIEALLSYSGLSHVSPNINKSNIPFAAKSLS